MVTLARRVFLWRNVVVWRHKLCRGTIARISTSSPTRMTPLLQGNQIRPKSTSPLSGRYEKLAVSPSGLLGRLPFWGGGRKNTAATGGLHDVKIASPMQHFPAIFLEAATPETTSLGEGRFPFVRLPDNAVADRAALVNKPRVAIGKSAVCRLTRRVNCGPTQRNAGHRGRSRSAID